MKFRALATAMAALAMTTTPVLAQASQAETASEVSRTSEATAEKSNADAGTIIAIIAAAAVIGSIILIATDDDDDEEPASP